MSGLPNKAHNFPCWYGLCLQWKDSMELGEHSCKLYSKCNILSSSLVRKWNLWKLQGSENKYGIDIFHQNLQCTKPHTKQALCIKLVKYCYFLTIFKKRKLSHCSKNTLVKTINTQSPCECSIKPDVPIQREDVFSPFSISLMAYSSASR